MSVPQSPPSAGPARVHKEYNSYWAIVWEQFRKNRSGYAALWAVFLLFAIAVYAPVLSSKMPFVWKDETGLSFPWFHSLVFNRNVYQSGIDIFFNLLLLLSPAVVVGWMVVQRNASQLNYLQAGKLQQRYVVGVSVGIILTFIALMMFNPRTLVPDYRELAQTAEGVFSLFPPLRIQYDDTLHGVEGPGLIHLMGKDNAGRDIFVRLVFGTRVSLSVGVIAVSIYVSIGTVLGAISGFFGGRTDVLVQRLLEIFLCFPSFFMILTFIGFLDQPSIAAVMVIIGFISWTGPARLVRGEFLRLKNMDFVAAARACGLSDNRIIFRHILPNAIGPVLVSATFGVASAVLVESSLSFLGFGDPTMPSWGRLLAFGRATGSTPMMLIAGFAIFVTVSVFNLAGEGFRDALDPKLRK